MKKQQALVSLLIVGAFFTSMILAAWLLPSKDFPTASAEGWPSVRSLPFPQ